MGLEDLGNKPSHFTRADDRGAKGVHRASDSLGEVNGHRGHAGRIAVEGCLSACPLADPHGGLKHRRQFPAGQPMCFGLPERGANLAKDLWFSQDHGVETGRHTAEVPGSVNGFVLVEIRPDLIKVYVLLLKKVDNSATHIPAWQVGVEFNPVAGGENDESLEPACLFTLTQRAFNGCGREDQTLTHGNMRSVKADAQTSDLRKRSHSVNMRGLSCAESNSERKGAELTNAESSRIVTQIYTKLRISSTLHVQARRTWQLILRRPHRKNCPVGRKQ